MLTHGNGSSEARARGLSKHQFSALVCLLMINTLGLFYKVKLPDVRSVVANQYVEQSQEAVTPTNCMKATTEPKRKKAKFVFTMGLEGTGHHLMEALYSASPHTEYLKKLGICCGPSQKTGEMETLLYHKHNVSLFTAWKEIGTNDQMVDLVDAQKRVAQLLVEMHDAIPDTENQTISIPVNTVPMSSNIAGMMSYPNFEGESRYLQHPNLNLFYQACDMAEVDCGHIYIYRDPYLVLRSTTHTRRFNNHSLEAMHLYETDLAVMTAQLWDHPHRTEGCFGFFEPNATSDAQMWNTMQDLLGWQNQTEFRSYLHGTKKIRKRTKKNKNKESLSHQELVPPEWQPAMDSWMTAHRRTIELCQANLVKHKHEAPCA